MAMMLMMFRTTIMIGLFHIVPFIECRQLTVSTVIILTCSALYICSVTIKAPHISLETVLHAATVILFSLRTANPQQPARLLHFGDKDGMALFGHIGEFAEGHEWPHYVERMEHFLSANGIDSNELKRAVFLSNWAEDL